jgi:CDP-glucose 4,6-dehydratase
MAFDNVFRGARVLVTGHTGFKGSWLCEWLLKLGAEVHGMALAPDTKPALFDELGLSQRVHHHVGDLRDAQWTRQTLQHIAAPFVFHLAAQPLVRLSYLDPLGTMASNVMGTLHLLEALRQSGQTCTLVVVSTDKCYRNLEHGQPYGEEDQLGGHDPYSASKAAMELVLDSYRRSFFATQRPLRVAAASARAGNVIGGGDWAQDRLLPDAIRALRSGMAIEVRNPASTRPWQHVLEPLSGYLLLAARLFQAQQAGSGIDPTPLCAAFNFGPDAGEERCVADLITEVLGHWPGQWRDASAKQAPHEAGRLSLSARKAQELLQWRPVWGFSQGVEQSVAWYRQHADNPVLSARLTREQIDLYTHRAAQLGLPWATS